MTHKFIFEVIQGELRSQSTHFLPTKLQYCLPHPPASYNNFLVYTLQLQ